MDLGANPSGVPFWVDSIKTEVINYALQGIMQALNLAMSLVGYEVRKNK